MSRADLLYELADLLVRVKGREAEADRHFRAALAANGATGAMHLAYAELLLALPDCAADARVQAQSALDADAKLAMRAHGIIGLSYLATSDPVTARPYLEGVYDTAPEQADFAFALFSLYIDAGERAAAERVFQNLADTPRGNDARRLFLNTDVPRADTLAREGKLLEAARILRDLAPKMPGKTRANLEGQAVRLESIAAMRQP
jgi:thioredoxin-like negative regulator of GroEL